MPRVIRILSMTLAIVCLSQVLWAQDDEPTGLAYLGAARMQEMQGNVMQALFLAGKAAGFSHFVDVTDEEYPPLLEVGTAEYAEAVGIIGRNNGYLEWTSPLMAAQHQSRIWSVRWSPDGKYIASSGMREGVRVWNVEDGSLLWSRDSDEAVSDLAWSPCGEYIAEKTMDIIT
ncbi:MAG: WD40 repeat domain-containing protein, partial [Desulfovibrio sp.]